MSNESRVSKAMLNMKVNFIVSFIAIVVSFFTRKVFLGQLGDEFIGLTTTINSLLAFLNLAELGVGASIAYFLYKPLFDDDREKICETISIMGYLYRKIGILILCAGIVASLFLPLIFKGTNIAWGIVYYCFYAQLASSLIGYFINYKANTIFSADQRQYYVNGFLQTTQIICAIVQMVLAWKTSSFTLYITVTLIFTLINCLLLNRQFDKVYPWVTSDYQTGKEALKERPEIIRYVKKVFIHQIGGFINNSVMPIIVYAYASLSMVTFYGNYTLLTSKAGQLINSALSGTSAGIGNLIAEGDRQRIYNCYKELYAIKFFVVCLLSLSLVYLSSDFITVWLGEEYVLSPVIVALICADFCLNLLRNTTDQYLDGYGLKADIWVPVCRICSLALVVLAGKFWGLAGLLAVPVLVQLSLMHVWKPYYLYSQGFRIPFGNYLKELASNTLPFVCSYLITTQSLRLLDIGEGLTTTWSAFLYKSICFCTILTVTSLILAYLSSEGIRLFAERMKRRIKKEN